MLTQQKPKTSLYSCLLFLLEQLVWHTFHSEPFNYNVFWIWFLIRKMAPTKLGKVASWRPAWTALWKLVWKRKERRNNKVFKHPHITKCSQKSLNLLQQLLHIALQRCLHFCLLPSLLLLLFFSFYKFSLRQPEDGRKNMNTVSSYLSNTFLTHKHLHFRSSISHLHC